MLFINLASYYLACQFCPHASLAIDHKSFSNLAFARAYHNFKYAYIARVEYCITMSTMSTTSGKGVSEDRLKTPFSDEHATHIALKITAWK